MAIATTLAWSSQATWPALAEALVGPKVTDPSFHFASGYLQQDDLPDSIALLGPPPAEGSAALARDEAAREDAPSL